MFTFSTHSNKLPDEFDILGNSLDLNIIMSHNYVHVSSHLCNLKHHPEERSQKPYTITS